MGNGRLCDVELSLPVEATNLPYDLFSFLRGDKSASNVSCAVDKYVGQVEHHLVFGRKCFLPVACGSEDGVLNLWFGVGVQNEAMVMCGRT